MFEDYRAIAVMMEVVRTRETSVNFKKLRGAIYQKPAILNEFSE
jgi:hypothetical protein